MSGSARRQENTKSGNVLKRSRLGFSWNRRWLTASHGTLQVRNTPRDVKPKLTIPLEFATLKLLPTVAGQIRFEVTTAMNESYAFGTRTSREGNEWMAVLRQEQNPIPLLSLPVQTAPISADSSPVDEQQYGEQDSTEMSATQVQCEAAWNESYQSVLEMEEHTFNMSVSKARSLSELVADFVAASVRLGKTIIDEFTLPPHLKSIAPLDLHNDNPENETFMTNGIVFQYMQEPDGSDEDDHLKRKMATHDLHGISAYANVSMRVKGIATYLCAAIDYVGFRLFALAMVPIFDDSRIAFGIVNGALHMERDAENLLEQSARLLNLCSHDVLLGDDETMQRPASARINTSSFTQVHRGEDGRLYITNLQRLFPIDCLSGKIKSADIDCNEAMQRLRPEFVSHYRKALSPDAFLSAGAADASMCDSDAAKASRYLRSRIVNDFVKELNVLEHVPIDSSHLAELMHARGINIRYLGVIAELTLLPHIREQAVCEMVARACKKLLAQNLRKMIRRTRLSRRADVTEYDTALNEKLSKMASSLKHEEHKVIVQFFNLVLGIERASIQFWKKVLHDQLATKFQYELEWDEARRLHKPLLFECMQHHCGVLFKHCGANITFSHSCTNSPGVQRRSLPLKIGDLDAVEARSKCPSISSMQCHEFPREADKYMKAQQWDTAIQALALKLELMQSNVKSNEYAGESSTSVTSVAHLPPAPPPPSKRCRSRPNNSAGWLRHSPYHRTLNDICFAYISKGDINAAREFARRALEISPGPDGNTAITYAHLVSIYSAQQHKDLADSSFKLSMSILRRLYGSHSPILLKIHDDVGSRYLQQGESKLAEEQFRHAITLSMTALGKSHPLTAQFYTRLGTVYHLEFCLDKAKDAHEKACLIYEGLYGAACPEVARACFYLSDIMCQKGDLKTARYFNQRALKIRLQVHGEHDPKTLDSYHQVAWQAHSREDHHEAIPYFEKLLYSFKNLPEPDAEILEDIKMMTKAVIRLQMRSLPMDQVAFLDKLYQESHNRDGDNSAITRMVIRKLYDESPSHYINQLLVKSCKGVTEPGYASSTAELTVILRLMETMNDTHCVTPQSSPSAVTTDVADDVSMMSYSIPQSSERSVKHQQPHEQQQELQEEQRGCGEAVSVPDVCGETNRRGSVQAEVPYFMQVKRDTIVRS